MEMAAMSHGAVKARECAASRAVGAARSNGSIVTGQRITVTVLRGQLPWKGRMTFSSNFPGMWRVGLHQTDEKPGGTKKKQTREDLMQTLVTLNSAKQPSVRSSGKWLGKYSPLRESHSPVLSATDNGPRLPAAERRRRTSFDRWTAWAPGRRGRCLVVEHCQINPCVSSTTVQRAQGRFFAPGQVKVRSQPELRQSEPGTDPQPVQLRKKPKSVS